MDPIEFHNLTEEYFTLKISGNLYTSVFTNMMIEQTIIKSKKVFEEPINISTSNESVCTKWAGAAISTHDICKNFKHIWKISFDSSQQHTDSRVSWIERDEKYVQQLME